MLESNVRIFIILRSGEGLTSFNKTNLLTFLVNQKYTEAFRAAYFFENTRKIF